MRKPISLFPWVVAVEVGGPLIFYSTSDLLKFLFNILVDSSDTTKILIRQIASEKINEEAPKMQRKFDKI